MYDLFKRAYVSLTCPLSVCPSTLPPTTTAPAPIHSLPPELILQIGFWLIYYDPAPDTHLSHLLAADSATPTHPLEDLVAATQVCRWWRALLTATPPLWSVVHLAEDLPLSRTRLGLAHAAAAPLDVVVRSWDPADVALLRTVQDRVRTLQLSFFLCYNSELGAFRFPALTSLAMESACTPKLDRDAFPALRMLNIDGASFQVTGQLPLEQVEVLVVRGAVRGAFLAERLGDVGSTLRELVLEGLTEAPGEPLVMSALTKLHLGGTADVVAGFLRDMEAPALRELCVVVEEQTAAKSNASKHAKTVASNHGPSSAPSNSSNSPIDFVECLAAFGANSPYIVAATLPALPLPAYGSVYGAYGSIRRLVLHVHHGARQTLVGLTQAGVFQRLEYLHLVGVGGDASLSNDSVRDVKKDSLYASQHSREASNRSLDMDAVVDLAEARYGSTPLARVDACGVVGADACGIVGAGDGPRVQALQDRVHALRQAGLRLEFLQE
ncbi:hypothetical protein BD626DRAFT_586498 [Schizophyllum amplum]|uniref:Uncharacterized protein n=1 Tax=Schizophyllum amplum TaxID=97359 RepID=A0A550BYT1_9AGAR|nr:hypothetical protein BD626DRAFT_586498 [Auriculariopsis ampla]